MSKVLFVGDVHAEFNKFQDIINECPDYRIIQVGDMGIGMGRLPYPEKFPDNVSWIFGNHDNPYKSVKHPNCLGKFGFIEELSLYYISGGLSIDKAYRVPGYSWWQDEELSVTELDQVIQEVPQYKPRIIVSHECPSTLIPDILGKPIVPEWRGRTSQALDVLYGEYPPEIWIFGHHHKHAIRYLELRGLTTKFIALGELDTYELEV